uniref:Uncharacterized protein n=1 Tax=Arundo donax TaxID=35708 RepID=A0A0A9GJ64_ARUDO
MKSTIYVSISRLVETVQRQKPSKWFFSPCSWRQAL